jgi:thiol-disulfide isomerase/thioredoxin
MKNDNELPMFKIKITVIIIGVVMVSCIVAIVVLYTNLNKATFRRMVENYEKMETATPGEKPVLDITNTEDLTAYVDAYAAANEDRLVLVKAYSDTCPACRMYKPQYAALASEFGSVAVFFQYDVYKRSNLSQTLKITVLPTTIVYKNGTEIARVNGANIASVRKLVLAHSSLPVTPTPIQEFEF